MLTCLELYLNAEAYAKHDLCKNTFEKGKFQTYNCVFVAAISDEVLKQKTLTNMEYVKETAMSIVNSQVFVPFLAVMALGNILHTTIHLLTDEMSDT